ncbi:MAG: hypothetical protein LBG48_04535 [Rickettsiales bacterium]|jgi:hypothetical protein|nr:hypothetical protein [Rickettsiales bacterium]MDR2830892.1 hypothetical protein [Candidatus Methanovirga basalitermitum]
MFSINLFDRIKGIKKKNTLQFLSIANIDKEYIELQNGDYLIFFRVSPKNISAMSEKKIREEINNFKTALSLTKHNLELIAFSSYENYDDVVQDYYHRIEFYRRENQDDIRISILESDIEYLNEINATRSGAKEFFIVLRINIIGRKNMYFSIRETEKLITEGGLNPQIVKGHKLFEIIQVYLENFRV